MTLTQNEEDGEDVFVSLILFTIRCNCNYNFRKTTFIVLFMLKTSLNFRSLLQKKRTPLELVSLSHTHAQFMVEFSCLYKLNGCATGVHCTD